MSNHGQRRADAPALRAVVLTTGSGTRATTAKATKVAVSRASLGLIAAKPRAFVRVMQALADSSAKAKKTGQAFTFGLRITPAGDIEPLPGPVPEAPSADPLDTAMAAAKIRGGLRAAEILNAADMLTGRQFAPLIGTSHETVNVKRKRFELLGLQGSTRGMKYPRWQLTDTGLPLPGLPGLFAILGEQAWTIHRFLLTAHAELQGRTALDALKAGEVEAVLAAARNQVMGAFA